MQKYSKSATFDLVLSGPPGFVTHSFKNVHVGVWLILKVPRLLRAKGGPKRHSLPLDDLV